MNFTPWALLVFAAVAVASTGAAMCDIVALSRLLVNGNVTTCSRNTGYNLTSLPAPTDAQISALCTSDACMGAVTTVTQIAPQECTIGSLRLYADVIDPLKQRCGRASGSMSAVGSGSGSGSSAGAIVIITSGSGSGSAADVGMSGSAGTASGSAAVSPAKTEPPKTSTPRPQPTTSTPKPTSGTGNAGVDAPALSTLTAALVLATVVGAIL